MNYIYNILINLENIPYDIFDWDENNIYEVNKTPIFRMDNLNEFYNNNIKITNEFLSTIKDKTKCSKKLEYSCVLVSIDDSLFCVFNSNGNLIYRSKMLYNEETEAISMYDNIKIADIKYCKNHLNYDYLKTKDDNIKKDYIIKEVKKLIKQKNLAKLEYLYYDCFGNYIDKDVDIINKIETNFNDVKDNLYNFLYSSL